MDKSKVTKDLENKVLVIERIIDAPRAKVWQGYSNKDWFVQWWGPEGWETSVKEFEFMPDGRAHYCMKCVDKNQGEFFGQESWGIMEFVSIDEPNGFTYMDYFSDAEGNVNGEMPGLRCELELVEADGKTTLISRCYGESAEDIEKLLAMGMVEGFGSSVDKLERLLAKQ
jgi:uncharacterized protein YndB with AHSA1/START domain